jgi:N-dimethylarginine dimethylaminohydrolase
VGGTTADKIFTGVLKSLMKFIMTPEETLPKAEEKRIYNPTTLDVPAFLLNAPFSYSTIEPNNLWMQDYTDADRRVVPSKAMRQFLKLYSYMASMTFVQVLPTPGGCRLQDLVFTANMGIILEHLTDKNTVIISKFASSPRVGETEVGVNFFNMMGYNVHVCPYNFEGEAELKHLYKNVYIGSYGTRSDIRAYEWMEEQFDMQIIKVNLTEEYLYHLDCSVFPITRSQTLVCTKLFTKEELREIENVTEILEVSVDDAFQGIANSVRVFNVILNASNIHELKVGTDLYNYEIKKNRRLEDIAAELGMEVCYFNLSEFLKGGAVLSCLVMHLNRKSYEVNLI